MTGLPEYGRKRAVEILTDGSFRGENVDRLLKAYKKKGAELFFDGNTITLTGLPQDKTITVTLSALEKKLHKRTLSRTLYSLRGSAYKIDHQSKVNAFASILYAQASPPFTPEQNFTRGKEYLKMDPKHALECFKRAADNGHKEALFMVVECLTPVNLHKEVKYLKQASKLKYAKASYLLWKTTQDLKYLKRAADQGSIDACFDLAQDYKHKKNPAKMLHYLKIAADGKHVDALFELGTLHKYGGHGVKEDSASSTRYYRKGARLGDHSSKTMLRKK